MGTAHSNEWETEHDACHAQRFYTTYSGFNRG